MNSQFTLLVRIVLGILLVVFGSNKFLHFIPLPPPTGSAADFMNSLGATGYIFRFGRNAVECHYDLQTLEAISSVVSLIL